MDKFTKRFYQKGNENNKKSGGSFPQYPIGKSKQKALEKKKGSDPQKRLNYLRKQIRKENISYGEIAELQGLKKHIDRGDVELREWAGIPEHE